MRASLPLAPPHPPLRSRPIGQDVPFGGPSATALTHRGPRQARRCLRASSSQAFSSPPPPPAQPSGQGSGHTDRPGLPLVGAEPLQPRSGAPRARRASQHPQQDHPPESASHHSVLSTPQKPKGVHVPDKSHDKRRECVTKTLPHASSPLPPPSPVPTCVQVSCYLQAAHSPRKNFIHIKEHGVGGAGSL